MNIVDVRGELPVHDSRTWGHRPLSAIHFITVHHQAGTGPLENVARYHVAPNHISNRGCPGFCYHYHIAYDGTISLTNDLTDTVWSCGKVKKYRFPSPAKMRLWSNMNKQSVGIMLQGDFDGEGHKGFDGGPTRFQLEALIRLRWHLLDHLGLPVINFIGHCHVNKRGCPGFETQDFIESLWEKPADLYIPESKELIDIINRIKNKFRVDSPE